MRRGRLKGIFEYPGGKKMNARVCAIVASLRHFKSLLNLNIIMINIVVCT